MGKNKNKIKNEILIKEPEEGAYCAEGVAHYITQLDLDANPGEEIGNIGDLVYIPFTPEQAEEYKIALEKENNEDEEKEETEENEVADKNGYRECTCGKLVILPIDGEEPTVCDCGVKHIW